MGKKTVSSFIILALVITFSSCGPGTDIRAGRATTGALVRLLPRSTMAVMAVDLRRALSEGTVSKMLETPGAKKAYEDFVAKTGIDPLKDVHLFVMGLSAAPGGGAEPEGGIILNLKFDRQRVLNAVKEIAPGLTGKDYNGVTIYSGLESKMSQATTRAAFLDDSNILIGSQNGLEGIIDVHKKKAESILKNKDMAALLKSVDQAALAWGAFVIPPDLLKKGLEGVPQLKVLEGVKAVTLSFDHQLSNYVTDIRTSGGTKDQNANLASTLSGLKGLGAMLAGQEPVVADLMNAIEISSGPDFVRIHATVSKELAEKLGQAVQKRAGDFIKIQTSSDGER